jgi:hypothetical protein
VFCFCCGFAASFLLIAAFWTVDQAIPSRNAIASLPLWRVYTIELSRLFRTSELSLGTNSSSHVLLLLVQHLMLAAVGGVFVTALTWWRSRSRLQST